jgi:general stress protein 26
MKNVKRGYMAPILFVVLLMPTWVYGQHENLPDSSDTKLIVAAKEIIAAAGICTLITLDEDGAASARAMDAFPPDSDFIIWFGTNPKSRKVKQIKDDPRVTLYYFDPTSASYVLIRGKAEIIDNSVEKRIHWKEAWQSFYPDYPENYLLIRVTPDWMEILSESRGITVESLTWQPPIVRFKK